MKNLLIELKNCGIEPFLNDERLILKSEGLEEIYNIELDKGFDFSGYTNPKNYKVSSLYSNGIIEGTKFLLGIAGYGKVVNYNGNIENRLSFDESLKNKALNLLKALTK